MRQAVENPTETVFYWVRSLHRRHSRRLPIYFSAASTLLHTQFFIIIIIIITTVSLEENLPRLLALT